MLCGGRDVVVEPAESLTAIHRQNVARETAQACFKE